MNNYDYDHINPLEFEEMCSAFLSTRDKVHYERFKEGKDGGIDLRYIAPNGQVTIVQCKRYKSFENLFAVLKNTEVRNVRTNLPFRYGVLTTCGLSPADKKKITELFKASVPGGVEVLGREDINDYLSQPEYRAIVERTMGLWWQSFDILKRTTLSGVYGRSAFVADCFEQKNKYTYWTKCLDEALVRLQNLRVIIMDGDPGVGKTTAAQMLALKAISDGHELVVVRDGIKEAEDAWRDEAPQVFYYDDFLGSNYKEVVTHSEASGICAFIDRVGDSANKLFILTSRTVILKRQEYASVPLKMSALSSCPYVYEVRIGGDWEKARVLYNRMLASDLPRSAIDEVLHGKNYIKIVQHRNFNPRIIYYAFKSGLKVDALNGGTFFSSIMELLNNPQQMWGTVFENQITPEEIPLVLATFLSKQVDDDSLRNVFILLGGSDCGYQQSIKSIVASVIDRFMDENGQVIYRLHDPSVGDYLISAIEDYLNDIQNVLCAMRNPQAVRDFFNIVNRTQFGRNSCAWWRVAVGLLQEMSPRVDDDVEIALVASLNLLESYSDVYYTKVVDKLKQCDVWQTSDKLKDLWGRVIVKLDEEKGAIWAKDIDIDISYELVIELMRCTDDFFCNARLVKIGERNGWTFANEDVCELLTCRLGEYASDTILQNMDSPDFDIEDGGSWSILAEEKSRLRSELESRIAGVMQEVEISKDMVDVGRILNSIDFEEYFQPDERDLEKYRYYEDCYEPGWRSVDCSEEDDIVRLFETFPRGNESHRD